jgi:indole-3-glycerol phosphate synthase
MTEHAAWLARKRAELTQIATLDARHVTPSIRDFAGAVRMGRRDLVGIPVIAAAPERARALAELAARADTAAVAVATDAAQGGSLMAMRAVSEVVGSTPVLRYDLVVHESQVYETRLAGGDATLIPAADVGGDLARLEKTTRSTRMTPFLLIHDSAGLELALAAGSRFVVVSAESRSGGEDLAAALRLCGAIPHSVAVCLAAPSFTSPEVVRPLLGQVDAALLSPTFPAELWPEVAVIE